MSRKLEELVPHDKENEVLKMYNCGPTVYSRQHIGNYRAFAEWDILHRALEYLGYKVERIVNITDVGHMTADEDFGEDKMEKSASESGKDPLVIADDVIATFLEDLQALNILHPDGTMIKDEDVDPQRVKEHNWTRATQYVEEMIEVIKRIERNGYTYETEQALYFDIAKFPSYTDMSGQSLDEKEVGVRDEVNIDPGKRHPADFVLWMKLYGKYKNHIMKWDSPWGIGFPGWHIECSAMGWSELGEYIDIHTGGVEHIGVHHSNERAQNYGAFGHDLVRMWVHNAWLVGKKGEKMSKSEGKVFTVPELVDMGFSALDLRYYYLSVKYRKPLYFSIEGLESARSSRASLLSKIASLLSDLNINVDHLSEEDVDPEMKKKFMTALSNDLNISEALAVLNEVLNSDLEKRTILATIKSFDKVLGLDLLDQRRSKEDNSELLKELLEARGKARMEKDYKRSDDLREEIEKLGYSVKDTSEGQKVSRIITV